MQSLHNDNQQAGAANKKVYIMITNEVEAATCRTLTFLAEVV